MKTKTKITLFAALIGIVVAILSVFKLGSESSEESEDTFI